MLDRSLQARFAKSYSDAAFGYANAATAAYANWASQAFEMMTGACAARAPRPRLVPRAAGAVIGVSATPTAGFPAPWMPFAWPGLPTSTPPAAAMNPFAAWLDMVSFRGSPAAWPMACMLIAAGIPRNVAWPTAEANAAAIEVADLARKSLETAFSTYRTDGGHATAQITWGSEPRNEPASPPAAAMALWPWLAFAR
jgi:hypothetical protein